MLDDSCSKGAPRVVLAEAARGSAQRLFVIVRKRHTTDVLIAMLISKYDFPIGPYPRDATRADDAISSRDTHGYMYVCAHTRVTSSSHELGVKEGFIFFYRAQHASFTYITTYAYNNNIKTLLGVSSDVGERAMTRL